MPTFSDAREAKEFLINCILSQAQQEGVSLSEVERKMLYFSETAWTLPDMKEISKEFDSCYNEGEFEQKIAGIVRSIRPAARAGDDWINALCILRSEDHYLLVLIDSAGQVRPRGDRIKLVLTALVIVGAVVAYALLR